MGKPIFARRLLSEERDELKALLSDPVEPVAKRAAIVLLSSDEGCRAPEISELVGMHASSVRYWIHRFNEVGTSALQSDGATGRRSRVDSNVRATLIKLATTAPREIGLKLRTWTLRELRKYLIEQEIVEEISHETIRRILKDENVDWRACSSPPKDSLVLDLLGTTDNLEPSKGE